MTAFVPSFATQQLLPPWNSRGCVRWGFVLEIDQASVAAYLDKFLNGNFTKPKNDRVKVKYEYSADPKLSKGSKQYGMLIFANHQNMFSDYTEQGPKFKLAERPGSDRLSCREVFFMMPALRTHLDSEGQPDGSKTVWVQPFSFCNSATVVFGSREIWGSDKMFATVDAEAPNATDLHVDVAFDGIQKFSPEAHSQPLGCIHVHKRQGDQRPLGDLLSEKRELKPFARLLMNKENETGDAWIDEVGESTNPAQIEFNNVKQFRDAHNMGGAIYRAIVASSAKHTHVEHLEFYSGAGVELDIMWSDSVAEMLKSLFGIDEPPGRSAPPAHKKLGQSGDVDWNLPRDRRRVELAFSFKSNVRFEVTETLHSYTDEPTGSPPPDAAPQP